MGDLHRDAGPPSDVDGLSDGVEQPAGLVADVTGVEAAVGAHEAIDRFEAEAEAEHLAAGDARARHVHALLLVRRDHARHRDANDDPVAVGAVDVHADGTAFAALMSVILTSRLNGSPAIPGAVNPQTGEPLTEAELAS